VVKRKSLYMSKIALFIVPSINVIRGSYTQMKLLSNLKLRKVSKLIEVEGTEAIC